MIKKLLIIFLFALTVLAQQNQMDQNQFMLAESYEQRGDINKAVEIVETLYKKDSVNIHYFNKLYKLYLLQKNYNKSIEIINYRLSVFPQDLNLYGMLGSVYYTSGERNQAYAVWEDAIDRVGSNLMSYRIMANYAIEKRDFEKAIEYLNSGKKVSGDVLQFSFELAELYSITMRYSDAAREYCDLLKANPSQYQQIENRILSYINKPNALDETINAVERNKSDLINFSYLLARLYIEKKDFDSAFELYKGIDKNQNSNGAELYKLADFVYREEQFQTAQKVYKYILENYNNQFVVPLAKLGYAKTLESLFKFKYLTDHPDWKPFSSVIPGSLNELDPVINAYEEITNIYKDSQFASEANLRIGLLIKYYMDDLIKAEKYLKIIIEDRTFSNFSPIALLELGNIFVRRGNLEEAKKYFNQVLNNRSSTTEDKSLANYNLARIYSFLQEFNSAREYTSYVLSNLKDNTANDAIEFSILLNTGKNDSSNLALYCEAEFLAEQKKFSLAKELYQRISANPQAFIFHSIAMIRAAEMMIAENDFLNVLTELSIIAEEKEKNIYADKALYLRGRVYQYALNNSEKAIESFEKLLADFPKSLYLNEARQTVIELKKKNS